MRALTTTQQATFASRYRNIKPRVWVDTSGGGVYQDLTSFLGYDWVQSISYDENIDNNVSAASITLSRAVFDLNLSPFYGASKANNGSKLLDIGRRIYIEAAITGMESPIASGDYVRVWQGFIDSVDPKTDTIEMQCRDEGSVLVDRFIETEAGYGSPTGATITSVLQAILTNNLGSGVVTLRTIGSPTFLLLPYQQTKTTVMDALLTIVQQIGWDLRYKWDPVSATFKLTLWSPDRTNTTVAAYTFGADDVLNIDSMHISREDVRNVVLVAYSDPATRTRQWIMVTDSASIVKYGRRYMEIQEASSSQIDTAAEALAMGNAALSDLKEPNAELSIELDYFWAVELGDLLGFTANGILFDSTQYFAVTSIKHDLSSENYKTTITVRGAPSTGHRSWLSIEGRPGGAPSSVLADPGSPQNVSITQHPMGFSLAHDLPPDPLSWAWTEVYIAPAPASIAQPTLGGKKSHPTATMAASGRSNLITVSNLLPASVNSQLYNVVAVLVDTHGNYSAMSPQLSVNVTRNTPFFENTEGASIQLIRNGDFNLFTQTTAAPPDFWLVGIWRDPATAPTEHSSWHTNGGSGRHCVYLVCPNTGDTSAIEIVSETVPFVEHDIIEVSCCYQYWGDSDISPTEAVLRVTFMGATGVGAPGSVLETQSMGGLHETGALWEQGIVGRFMAPLGTRYIKVHAIMYGDAGGAQRTWYLDRIGCARGKPALTTYCDYVADAYSTDTDAPIMTHGTLLGDGTIVGQPGSAGFFKDVAHDAWTVRIGGYYQATLQASLHSTNLFSGADWTDIWIEASADNGATWDRFGYQKAVTDDNGYATVLCTTPAIYLPQGALIRPAIRPTETFEIDSSKELQSSFTVMGVARGDV